MCFQESQFFYEFDLMFWLLCQSSQCYYSSVHPLMFNLLVPTSLIEQIVWIFLAAFIAKRVDCLLGKMELLSGSRESFAGEYMQEMS